MSPRGIVKNENTDKPKSLVRATRIMASLWKGAF